MPRFFIDKNSIDGQSAVITGEDARHISRSLRMRCGESLVLCDCEGTDYQCVISAFTEDSVMLTIESSAPCETEPSCRITLYQGFPKGDKLEFIVEKAVELGVCEIVPVLTCRSVSRPDERSGARKAERLRRHALEAAKQCGRGIVPSVADPIPFSALPKLAAQHQLTVVFYEGGGQPLAGLITTALRDVAVVIGPEGGLDEKEVAALTEAGAICATLGKRILRTETAALTAAALVMYATGNMN